MRIDIEEFNRQVRDFGRKDARIEKTGNADYYDGDDRL